jgi:hypothetical protein
VHWREVLLILLKDFEVQSWVQSGWTERPFMECCVNDEGRRLYKVHHQGPVFVKPGIYAAEIDLSLYVPSSPKLYDEGEQAILPDYFATHEKLSDNPELMKKWGSLLDGLGEWEKITTAVLLENQEKYFKEHKNELAFKPD